MTDSRPLFPVWLLTLFITVVAAVLYLLFPGAHLLDTLNKQPADTTSIHYMQALLASHPKDAILRENLALELFETGQLKQSKTVLEPLMQQPDASSDMRLLYIRVCFPLYFEAAEPVGKNALKTRIQQDITALYPQLERIEDLEQLANWSSEMGWPTLAAAIYAHILTLSGIPAISATSQPLLAESILQLMGISIARAQAESDSRPPVYYAIKQLQALLAGDAGDEALQQAKRHVEHFPTSRELLELAIKIASFQSNAAQARDWSRLLLQRFGRSLEATRRHIQLETAANQPDNSLIWVQKQLAHSPDSVDLLNLGIQLAIGLQKNTLALKWSQQLLDLDPENAQLLQQNIQIILQTGNPKAALSLAQRRVDQDPDNTDAREALAQIARWANKPETAMQQWQWLYLQNSDKHALKQTLELAKALFRPDVTVAVLTHLSTRQSLTAEQLDTWYQALEASGDEDGGIRQLNAYLQRWPGQKTAWQYLVRAQLQTGALQSAIDNLAKLQQRFGFDATARMQQIQTMIELGQVDAGWQLAQQTRHEATIRNLPQFWRYYAQVASLLGAEQSVADSYKALLASDSIQSEELDWLLLFSRNTGHSEDYIDLTLKAWATTGEPQFLLDASRYEIEQGKWESATQILQRAQEKPRDFISLTDYWVIKAQLAQHHSDSVSAQTYLRQALKLAPDSADLYATLLWLLIDANDTTGLHTHITTAARLAPDHPQLWEPLVAAYRLLDQPERALPWYRTLIRQAPQRYLLRLDYADALEAASSWKTARLVRRHTLSSVRQQLALKPDTPAAAADLQRRYTQLIRQHAGIEASHQWLRWLDRHHSEQSAVYEEFRIAWHLTQHQPRVARYRLLRAHQQRLQIPVWQNLAVALANHDEALIEAILQHNQGLTPSGRISGLVALRQETAALEVALHHLAPGQKPQLLQPLRQQASELSLRNPNGFAASLQARNINHLDLLGYKLTLAKTIADQPLTLSVQSSHLSSDDPEQLFLQSNQNWETAMTAQWLHRRPYGEGWLAPALYIRGDENLMGIKAGFNYTVYDGWHAQTELAFNEMSEESAPFRLLGARDRVTLGLTGELSKREYFNLRGHTRHYKTRGGQSLGHGYGVDLEAGYRLHFDNPGWNLALHGSWNRSDLDTQLPALFAPLLPQEPVMASVLSDRYQEVGLKTQLNRGSLKPFGFVDRSFRYHMEAGMFYLPLARNMGFQFTGDVATRLFGRDELSLFGHFADAQGGVNTRPGMSMGLRYSRRF